MKDPEFTAFEPLVVHQQFRWGSSIPAKSGDSSGVQVVPALWQSTFPVRQWSNLMGSVYSVHPHPRRGRWLLQSAAGTSHRTELCWTVFPGLAFWLSRPSKFLRGTPNIKKVFCSDTGYIFHFVFNPSQVKITY